VIGNTEGCEATVESKEIWPEDISHRGGGRFSGGWRGRWFSDAIGAQSECIGVEESEGERGSRARGKIPKRSLAPI
jgi:hypothetical protein